MSLPTGWVLPLIALLALYGPPGWADATISPADLRGWQETSFEGHTVYRAAQGGNGRALHALARGTASGLCRPVALDLASQPILRWSWRLDRAPLRRDERAKEGDDQGLRVTFLHAPAGESILAIQYVWSQSGPAGAIWPNPFAGEAREIAARSGPPLPGEWRQERRNLHDDFQAAFGRAVQHVDAVCLMTDGDQTGALVEGWYGDITLQAK
jgi:hypothetical protein